MDLADVESVAAVMNELGIWWAKRDFAVALPKLDTESSEWLRTALSVAEPSHRWTKRVVWHLGVV
jgi:hypothetical protein